MISIVAAMDEQRVIGRNGDLPWHLPEDLKHFRELTLNKPIAMGRKTHESIGRPLDERENIVLSRQEDYESNGCHVVSSIEEAIDVAGISGELMVIGGESIFRAFLPRTDRLLLTIIHDTFEGDTYFPTLDHSQWTVTERDNQQTSEQDLRFSYFTIHKKSSSEVSTTSNLSMPSFLVGEPTRT